ncbi:MAG: OB-fold nucleic acid binding domain-containing protein [Ornithinimicrobium sp.]
MSALTTLMSGLLRSQGDVEAEEIAAECARPGCVTIRSLSRREHATITGTVHSVAVPPKSQRPEVRVELYDGSGILELIWLGRRSIVGIEPGTYLTVQGRVACNGGNDRLVMYNPSYDLLPHRG